MDLRLIQPANVVTFMLVLIRISGLLMTAPLFANKGIPAQTKIGLIVALSLLLYPLQANAPGYHAPQDIPDLIWIGSQELMIGLLLGFAASLMFSGIQLAGEYISIQMGLSVATVLDPVNSAQVPVIGQFFYFLALLIFLGLNLHHTLIIALNKSFEWLPLGHAFPLSGVLTERMMVITTDMFLVALLFALPVLGVLIVSEMATAFVAKVMPQMNIFTVSIPLKVSLALIVIMITLPFSEHFLADHYATLVQHVMGLYRLPPSASGGA